MSTAVLAERIAEQSPSFKARIAGACYSITFLAGGAALFLGGGSRWSLAANLTAATSYVAVTFLLYFLFKPVNRRLSWLAAFFSLAGCGYGALSLFHLAPFRINSLVFFGVYCLLVGYLIFRSTFLPRILGAGMTLAGLGWLTFLSPALASYLSPYNLATGILAEGLLTLWLLAFGVDAERWQEQAGARRHP